MSFTISAARILMRHDAAENDLNSSFSERCDAHLAVASCFPVI